MLTFKIILSAVIGYLFGSISIAVILTKYILHSDVRTQGSGNAGATNVARTFGLKIGILTLVGDFSKTVISALIGKALAGDTGLVFACAGCIIGHSWPVFFNFKGGKGIAVGAMIGLMLDWRLFVALVVIFFLGAVLSKRVSVGSVACAICFPFILLILGEISALRIVFGFFVGAVVAYLHRENIKRLIKGTEPEFKAKKTK